MPWFKVIVFSVSIVIVYIVFFGLLNEAIKKTNEGIPGEMKKWPKRIFRGIAGILATNFGAVIGLNIEQIQQFGFGSFLIENVNPTMGDYTAFQIIAVLIYFFSLLGIFIWWWSKMDFEEDSSKIVNIIPEQGVAFWGIVLGAFTVALGV